MRKLVRLGHKISLHEYVMRHSSRAGRAQSLDKAIAFVTDIQGFLIGNHLTKSKKFIRSCEHAVDDDDGKSGRGTR